MRFLLLWLPIFMAACDAQVILGKSQGQGGPDARGTGDMDGGTVSGLHFSAGISYATGSQPGSLAIADLSGDGKPDIAVASATEMRLLLLIQDSTGAFQPGPTLPAGGGAVAAADLSGDGRADLVVGGMDGALRVYIQAAQGGSFTERARVAVCAQPAALLVADLSGDGVADVAVACADTDQVAVLLGQGGGALGAPVRYTVGHGPRALAAADVQGLGHLDLVSGNRNSGDFSLLAGQGGGAFAMAETHLLLPEVTGVALVDLTHDGHPDLCATSFSKNELIVAPWLGGGFYPEKGSNPYPIAMGPVALSAADLDHDGRPDLVSANASGSVTVLLDRADGRLGDPQEFAAGNQPGALATGDLNGDGLPDLVVAQPDGVLILLNQFR